MLTMVHIREIVQFAAYIGCFALVAAVMRQFRVYFRRSAMRCWPSVVGLRADLHACGRQTVVGLVGDIVADASRGIDVDRDDVLRSATAVHPAPALLRDFVINSDQTVGRPYPAVLVRRPGGPAAVLATAARVADVFEHAASISRS